MPSFLGMRGNADWVANQRPENWRQMIAYLYPNGDAQLTALMSMLSDESVDDPHFHWWTKKLPEQKCDITGIYTDSALSTAYSGNNLSADGYVFVKGSEVQIKEFKPSHTVKLMNSDDYRQKVVGKVTQRIENGANSYVAIKLLQDTNATHDITNVNLMKAIGTANPEGGTLSEAIAYDPVEFSNYTQIFNTPLSITRTARKTRLRTGDQYQEAKRECLELHSLELEKAFINSVKSIRTGANGKPERTMDGILPFVETYAASNVTSYKFDEDFNGSNWVTGGGDWLDKHLEVAARYGSWGNKVALCGSGAKLGINKLAKAGAEINITPETTEYGSKIGSWVTAFGTLPLITHPLFSRDAEFRNSIIIIDKSNIKYRFIDDTFFISDAEKTKNTHPYVDGVEEGYLTECSLELHHPETFYILHNLNEDNPA